MLGNVDEWVDDFYEDDYYRHSPSQDPAGPTSGMWHVLRGGSLVGIPAFVRLSSRNPYNPDSRYSFTGVRCEGKVLAP